MNTNTLNLVPLSQYQVPYENYYFQQSDRFGTSKKELFEYFGIHNEVYVNKHIAQLLSEINLKLQKQWLQLFVKDGYRSVEFYEYLDILWEKTHPTRKGKLLNVSKQYAHSTGNTVDIIIVDQSGKSILLRDESLRSQEQLFIKSMTTLFYKNDNTTLWKTIHKNRMFLKSIMEQYGFSWISTEYRHYEYQWPHCADNN